MGERDESSSAEPGHPILVIRERFRGNLERVTNLVALYETVAGSAQGRPSVHESDVLRAAVVFLHACVEDLLRSLAEWRLPEAPREVLSQIPFAGGDGRSTRLTLGDLALYRGKAVAELITESVMVHLGRTSYNGTSDIASQLEQIGVGPSARKEIMDKHAAGIGTMMSRRHHIVHRLDRNEAAGRGQHPARSIGKTTLLTWIEAVRSFGEALLDEARRL